MDSQSNPILVKKATQSLGCWISSNGGLSAEQVERHGGEEGRNAFLVMQMKVHHLSQSFGELGFHELHTSFGALKEAASQYPSLLTCLEAKLSKPCIFHGESSRAHQWVLSVYIIAAGGRCLSLCGLIKRSEEQLGAME